MSLPDRDSGSTYGALSKVNYQNLPPADPTTDWSNPLLAPGICNIAGLTQTAPRVCLTMTLAASDGYLVVNSWFAVWGNVTTTAPVLHRVSTGIFTITWPTVVSDEYDASLGIYNNHTVNLTKSWGNLQNSTTLHSVSCYPSLANQITVNLVNNSNALNDFVGFQLDVFAL